MEIPLHIKLESKLLAAFLLTSGYLGGLPDKVDAAARRVRHAAADADSIQLLVHYLEYEIEQADYWGPPEQVWDALEELREWMDSIWKH